MSIYTELALKYGLAHLIVETICKHPFMFASRRIEEGDPKLIRFAYLGKLKLKNRYAKKTADDNEHS